MRQRVLLFAALVGVALALPAPADGPQMSAPVTSREEVGTIVFLMPVTDAPVTTEVDLGLRVDASSEVKSAFKPGEVLKVRVATQQMRRIRLGDQVRATFDQAPAADRMNTAKELARLGRGEFLNPGEKATVDLGPPDAKVLVKMFAPLGVACHQTTVDLLKELAAAEPTRVRVQIYDIHEEAARDEVNRERLTCATVLVNNRYQFSVREGDKERKVEFSGRPNYPDSTYNSQDVVTVVRQEIARIYGPAKPQTEPKS